MRASPGPTRAARALPLSSLHHSAELLLGERVEQGAGDGDRGADDSKPVVSWVRVRVRVRVIEDPMIPSLLMSKG